MVKSFKTLLLNIYFKENVNGMKNEETIENKTVK